MEPIEHRKLFVGGVSRETNEFTLREYFSQYGKVEESLIIRQRLTGIGRGFGFVVFSAVSMAEDALKHKDHVILGRKVEVKKAIPKGHRQGDSNGNTNTDGDGVTEINTKIFVGGLPRDIKEEEFKSYFESFGTVIDSPVMPDKVTGRPRGFGFITFDSEDAVDNVLQNRFHELKNKMVEVKRARPKDSNDKYMNFYDGNYASLFLRVGFFHSNNINYCSYPDIQTYQSYSDWSSCGFGGWGSPSNLIVTLPSRGLLASGNPSVPHSNVFCPSCGLCINGYCNGSYRQVAESSTSGNSNGDYDSGVVQVPEARNLPPIHDLSSLKFSGVEHQEGKMDDLSRSESNAAELQIVEIHDSTVQKPLPQSTKSEQNGQSSHDSDES